MLAWGADVMIVILVYRIIPYIEFDALSKYSLDSLPALQMMFNIRLWCPPGNLADARRIHQLQVAKSLKMLL